MDPLMLIGGGLALYALFRSSQSSDGGASPVAPPPQLPAGGASPSAGPRVDDRQRLDAAATIAKLVVANLKSGKIDRTLLRQFQTVAGLAPDGIYGPKTAGALKWYTGVAIPPHVGKGSASYAPPTSRSSAPAAPPRPAAPHAVAPPPAVPPPAAPVVQVRDRQRLDAAATIAKLVVADIQKSGKRYNRNLLKKFQQVAGLAADGLYGPKSAGALKWYTNVALAPLVGKGFATYLPNF